MPTFIIINLHKYFLSLWTIEYVNQYYDVHVYLFFVCFLIMNFMKMIDVMMNFVPKNQSVTMMVWHFEIITCSYNVILLFLSLNQEVMQDSKSNSVNGNPFMERLVLFVELKLLWNR